MIENSYKHIAANLSLNKLFYYTCYYFIAVVLFVSGVSKIIDPQPLLDTLNLIKILSDEIRIAIATALPMVELTIAALLIARVKVKLTLVLASILFFSFLVFSVYGTIAGFNAECGCFGKIYNQKFNTVLIIRNIIFFIISINLWFNKKKKKL
ncbi:MAG: methylamine utilization protein [Ignavibacteriales bacterium]|nr:methylamine utilization protein [Ignavibacteriales bacterium]